VNHTFNNKQSGNFVC